MASSNPGVGKVWGVTSSVRPVNPDRERNEKAEQIRLQNMSDLEILIKNEETHLRNMIDTGVINQDTTNIELSYYKDLIAQYLDILKTHSKYINFLLNEIKITVGAVKRREEFEKLQTLIKKYTHKYTDPFEGFKQLVKGKTGTKASNAENIISHMTQQLSVSSKQADFQPSYSATNIESDRHLADNDFIEQHIVSDNITHDELFELMRIAQDITSNTSMTVIEKINKFMTGIIQQQTMQLKLAAAEKQSTTGKTIDELTTIIRNMFMYSIHICRTIFTNHINCATPESVAQKSSSICQLAIHGLRLHKHIVLVDVLNMYYKKISEQISENKSGTHLSFTDFTKTLYRELSELGNIGSITFICVRNFRMGIDNNDLISIHNGNIVEIVTQYRIEEIRCISTKSKQRFKTAISQETYNITPYKYHIINPEDCEDLTNPKNTYIPVSHTSVQKLYNFNTNDDFVIAMLLNTFFVCGYNISVISGDNFAWFRLRNITTDILKVKTKTIKFGSNVLEPQDKYYAKINNLLADVSHLPKSEDDITQKLDKYKSFMVCMDDLKMMSSSNNLQGPMNKLTGKKLNISPAKNKTVKKQPQLAFTYHSVPQPLNNTQVLSNPTVPQQLTAKKPSPPKGKNPVKPLTLRALQGLPPLPDEKKQPIAQSQITTLESEQTKTKPNCKPLKCKSGNNCVFNKKGNCRYLHSPPEQDTKTKPKPQSQFNLSASTFKPSASAAATFQPQYNPRQQYQQQTYNPNMGASYRSQQPQLTYYGTNEYGRDIYINAYGQYVDAYGRLL